VNRRAEERPPRLTALATALPREIVRQEDARSLVTALFKDQLADDDQRLFAVFENTGIEKRHICMPLEWYAGDHDFGERNTLYIEHALALASRAIRDVLDQAGLAAGDVDHLMFVSSTGLATPSLDARLANALGMRGDVRRTPIWGLGCAGGAAGLARARDFALADPAARVLLVSLELCSLTFQRREVTRRNLVATSLFSDGAAAALVLGPEAQDVAHAAPRGGSRGAAHPGHALELLAAHSTLWPDTLDVMGWEVDAGGLHVVFSRDIPTIVRDWVRPNLDAFLASHGLDLTTLTHIIAHPGGPKVLSAYAASLGLPADAFRHSAAVLRECGNMSSPTCLFVLERALAAGDIRDGDTAVLAALGPGFASEYVLMRGTTT
jgi:alkylresorcinol/alkylpyrone synthase